METKESNLKLTRAEAAEKIKGAPVGTKFALHLAFDVPITNGCTALDGGKGYAVVGRSEAARIVLGMFSDNGEAAGYRVPLCVREVTHSEESKVTYWIG